MTDKSTFKYYDWTCYYTPLVGWRAWYISKPKVKQLEAHNKAAIKRAVNKHRMTWHW